MTAFERLSLRPPIEPMETRQMARVPEGDEWVYEPKWDGFRCIAFRDGDDVELQSKSGETLTRYFPEAVEALRTSPESRFVVDGELMISTDGGSDFDLLLQRIHPAASRVSMLAKRTPATYALFDLLIRGSNDLYPSALLARKAQLESFVAENFAQNPGVVLSPATTDVELARQWLSGDLVRLDGIIAKKDVPYAFGSRDAVVKIKRSYSADCVVGGFRRGAGGIVASLLLGLYDDEGLLDHVGFVGSMSAAERKRAGDLLEPIVEPPGFTGNAPGGPSRWRREESPWFPVRPEIVVEIAFDHVTGRRFRHAARLLRWRPDKAPRQCMMDQLTRPTESSADRQARP
jgi:ATP-dependent DNA ligase